MNNIWHDELPIYKQMVLKLKKAILEGNYIEGTALPSVRVVSSEMNINHITVSKAYNELVMEGLIEKRRGLGMFILHGAINKLIEAERAVFMQNDLPKLIAKMEQLEIDRELVIDIISQPVSAPIKGNVSDE